MLDSNSGSSSLEATIVSPQPRTTESWNIRQNYFCHRSCCLTIMFSKLMLCATPLLRTTALRTTTLRITRKEPWNELGHSILKDAKINREVRLGWDRLGLKKSELNFHSEQCHLDQSHSSNVPLQLLFDVSPHFRPIITFINKSFFADYNFKVR